MDKSFEAAFLSALEWWDEIGVEVPKLAAGKPKPRRPAISPAQKAARAAPPPPDAPQQTDRLKQAKKIASSAKTLADLHAALKQFDAGTLSDNAVQTVFARGNPDSRVMIIGEVPSREEDIEGKPFTGRAGQLLDKMMAAIGLSENEFYISNVVNWRTPGNRAPTPEEIALCRPFLNRHIELAAPDILLITGGVSLTAMTGLTGIMKNRGHWQNININGRDIPALPIYHPAFLLRRPELKKDVWRDLLSLHERLNASQ